MKITQDLYQGSLSLLTDYYQLSMAYAYWQAGKAEREAVFTLYFRKNPFQGGFTVAAGLDYVLDFCANFRFDAGDLAYLAAQRKADGTPTFESGFIQYLEALSFSCTIEAVEEGTVVFPYMPLVRVRGPLVQCQLLETPLLNILNFQTLIATKAARIKHAAKGDKVLEFGLRRAQGIDGALAASRAAYIGGCDATSNVMAGKLFGIPVSGTHAHSWIMSFDSELEAFRAYAASFPDTCTFLVDTYDTEQGVRNAITVGRELRERGYEMQGVRIDSGDLAYYSQLARRLLDEAGFPNAVVVASNDLDEQIITSLKLQEAAIQVWGVGTKLVTAYDQPALGAVYKLSAIRDMHGNWVPKVKLSQQSMKINIPGLHGILRFFQEGKAVADMLIEEKNLPLQSDTYTIIDPLDPTRRKKLKREGLKVIQLLVPVFEAGKLVYQRPTIHSIRARTQQQLAAFDRSHKRLINPHLYPLGLERDLYQLRNELVLRAKGEEL
ncbi:MAG: nicotinate phosphoribosyltransferase [Nitritalea sp.]